MRFSFILSPFMSYIAYKQKTLWVDNSSSSSYLKDIEKAGRIPRPNIPYIESIDQKKRTKRIIIQPTNSQSKNSTTVAELIHKMLISRPTPSRSTTISSEGVFQLESDTAFFNFSKVGGYTETKKELLQVSDMLLNQEKYTQHGVRVPKGILFEGPPGNGKTLLAKCFAGECNTSFIRCSGSDFNEKFIGVGSSRIRELFDLAKQNQPCVLFIDEIDAIGRKRGSDEGTSGERDTTLNQLLVCMDGFEKNEQIVVVGATNRIDILDRAILRPGRFDKILHVPNPDKETRDEILQIYLKKKPIQVEKKDLVSMTAGWSGAMIENLLNEAVLFGIRENRLPISKKDLDKIKEKVLFGVSIGKKELSEKTQERIAVHESGHLLVALLSPNIPNPIRVTIETQGKESLGMTIFQEEDMDLGFYIRDHLDEKIRVLLGGRAAEEIVYGSSVSSGSVSDLQTAAQIVNQMVTLYGMGNGLVYPFLSDDFKKKIDLEIFRRIEKSYSETKTILIQNRELLDAFVQQLLQKKHLDASEIEYIMDSYL